MDLQLLEKMPESFRFFGGKEIRTLVDQENEELWFVAKDIANILEYSKFDSNLVSKIPNEWKDTKQIRTLGGNQKMVILSEQGLYFFVARSDKPQALPFQKWIAGEVIPSIRKNGFYISEDISDNQVLDLVEESLSIYENRKLFDLELRKLKSEIYGELINQGATKKQIGGIFANMFQNLHIATTKRTAGQVVFDEMKTQKRKLSIKSFNQLRKYPKAFKKDMLIAINYYSDEELSRFREYLKHITTGISLYIKSPHTKITLATLKREISYSSEIFALKMTNYEIERFPRPLRSGVAELLNLLTTDGKDKEIFELFETIRVTYHNLNIAN